MTSTRRDFLKYTGAAGLVIASSDLVAELLAQLVDVCDVLRRREQDAGRAAGGVEPDRGEVPGEAERVRPRRLARRQRLPGVERLGEVERAPDQLALGPRQPFGDGTQRGGARLRM